MPLEVSDAHAHVQSLVSVVKMMIVLNVLPKSRVLFCIFLHAKRLVAKDVHKEMFIVCCGKRLSRKAVHNSVEKFSQKMPDQARKWLRQQSKDFRAAGFDALVEAIGQCINVEKYMSFCRFEYQYIAE
jgi:uncharacterized protein (UPF0128 family)